MGNLRDIVHWVKQEELKSEIKRMFQNNQIKANSGNWYGDDRHELREKLYQLGDDKAERFIIVGGKNAYRGTAGAWEDQSESSENQ